MKFFSWINFKNFLKTIFFILIIGIVCYFTIDTIQYKYNLMDIEEYEPVSTLVVKENIITKAKYPFIDVHNHQFDMPLKDLSKLIEEMDSMNMAYMVNLSGFRGIYLEKSLENINKHFPNRFGLFLNIDFEKIDEQNFAKNNIELITEAVSNGVIGLKVYKSFYKVSIRFESFSNIIFTVVYIC